MKTGIGFGGIILGGFALAWIINPLAMAMSFAVLAVSVVGSVWAIHRIRHPSTREWHLSLGSRPRPEVYAAPPERVTILAEPTPPGRAIYGRRIP